MKNFVRCEVNPQRDLSKEKFARLQPVEAVGRQGGSTVWLCVCDCGEKKLIKGYSITSKATQSCGCLNKEIHRRLLTKHGKSNTPIYKTWEAMIQRATNPNHSDARNYTERNITVCDEWRSFENFYKDMGDRPFKKAQIDRINNNKGYFKNNCRWVTHRENQNNKRGNVLIEFKGITKTLMQWSVAIGIHYNTLQNRMNKGWGVEKTLTQPAQQGEINVRNDCKRAP